jgi:4-cresol dehydrogenase (hydroxylating)
MTAGNPNDKSLHQNMTEAQIDSIAGKHGIAEWLIMGSLYATKDSIKATKKYIESKATFASEVMFSDSLSIKLGLLLTKYVMKSKKTQLDLFQLSTDIMLGKPNQVALPLAYWRNPKVEPNIYNALNPAKDKCGLLWYAPLVPMNATNMRKFIDFIRETTPKYNIEPLITFSCLSAGYLDATVPIIFNASDPNAIEKAHACVDELFDGGIKKGFVPYRLSTKMQATKLDSEAPHWKVTKLIKQALDPNSIISPGRYNPT